MKPEDFPNPTPPATIENVAFLLDRAGIGCRYNTVKKKIEIDIPAHAGTSENRDNVTLTTILSLAAEHGMPTGNIDKHVDAIADRHAYNPVTEWIRSIPWDGTDRFAAINDTIVAQEEYPLYLKPALLRKWLRSAAAANVVPNYKGRGVLTFQGEQGIGKTSWVKALVSDPALRDSVVKLDHHLDTSNKDTILGAIEHWIVELGELDSSFKKDVGRLKGFITSDSDRVRRPYGRRECSYPRQTLFVATVNDPNFLVDTTGNSRWWTIAVNTLDYHHQIDTQQLFAQMADEVKSGGTWWLDEHEEALLNDWNAHHTATSVVADRVSDLFTEVPGKRTSIVVATPTEVLRFAGIAHPTNGQARECGALLRERFGRPSRINGRDKWRVPLAQPTLDGLINRPEFNSIQTEEIF